MAQQINLYNPALRRQRQWLTLTNVAVLVVAFAVLLGAVGGVMRVQAATRQAAAQSLEVRLQALRTETAQLGGQLNGGAAGDLAARELADLKRQVVARREILNALQNGSGVTSLAGNATAGFADYLRGLARQSVDGLWLTGFSVAQGGSGMEVRGRMLAVDRLPEYIKRLNSETHFKGRQFVSLNISRSDRATKAAAPLGTPYATFVLAATPDSKDGSAKGKEAAR